MSDLLQLDFLRHALTASLLIGFMLSVIGIFVVLRRIVFVGAALAQASAAGVALAMFIAGMTAGSGSGRLAEFLKIHPETVAVLATLAAAAMLSIRPARVAIPSEGAIGLGYALASTVAILLIAKAPGAEGDTLMLFYGNILAVKPKEIVELSFMCPAVLLVHFMFKKEFLMISVSPDTARAAGVRVALWNLVLYVVLGMGIATGIRVAGSLLTFSYLVVPALTGLMIARKTVQVPVIAVAVALSATVVGILASVRWDLPSGPCIVAALIAAAGCVWVVARVSA